MPSMMLITQIPESTSTDTDTVVPLTGLPWSEAILVEASYVPLAPVAVGEDESLTLILGLMPDPGAAGALNTMGTSVDGGLASGAAFQLVQGGSPTYGAGENYPSDGVITDDLAWVVSTGGTVTDPGGILTLTLEEHPS